MTNIKLFQDKKIRSSWNDEEEQWYFSVVDVVEALTDSPNPRQYWRKMKDRDLSVYQSYPFWVQLKMPSSDGKKYATDCANVKGLLCIIQAIPSPKAEPFKQWLAQVGYERMLEIENPELAQERMKELYEKKGYPKDWIDKRLRGIARFSPCLANGSLLKFLSKKILKLLRKADKLQSVAVMLQE